MNRLIAAGAAILLTAGVAAAQAPYAGCDPKPRPNYLPQPDDDPITARAKAIHARILTLDTHVDIEPGRFQIGQPSYCNRLTTQVDLTKMEEGGLSAIFFSIYVGQGPLDSAGFARAYATDTAKFNAVHRLAEQIAPDRIAIAYTAADARRIFASGKKVAFMGVENGYGIGNDITRVKEFYDRGGRYMSLAHNGHSQLSDSNTGEADGVWMWHGLSPLGKKVIAEMNKWGMMIDVSHPSKESMMQAIALSKAPIIASHSAVHELCGHSRDLDDESLKALARNGGVVQVVAFTGYVNCDPKRDAARTQAMAALRTEYGIAMPAAGGGRGAGGGGGRGAAGGGAGGGRGAAPAPIEVPITLNLATGTATIDPAALSAAQNALLASRTAATPSVCSAGGRGGGGGGGGGRGGGANAAVDSQLALMPAARRAAYQEKLAAINARYPAVPRANVMDFVDHIDYAVKLIGIDHVGISSDFDGGGGIDGYNCALEAFNVTRELVRRGYTEEQIAKIWSGNLLRVLGQVEKVAKQIQAKSKAK